MVVIAKWTRLATGSPRLDEGAEEEQRESLMSTQHGMRAQMPALSHKWTRSVVGWILLGISLATLTILAALIPTIAQDSKPEVLSCAGKSRAELERDCSFDIMSFSWVPHVCYDAELTSEFEAQRSWQYYTELNGTEAVSHEQVKEGRASLYVTWEHHLTHCVYEFRKFHRAVLAGGPIDSYCGRYAHTTHCSSQLLEAWTTDTALQDVNTFIELKTPDCLPGTRKSLL